jgi:hypothetical protein
MGKYEWLFYVGLAGLAWGTYVPIIFYGGSELGKPGPSPRFMAILCVGTAYFVIGVLFPLVMLTAGWGGASWSNVRFANTGLIFSGLAGVAGAVGAICVVFATQSARSAAIAVDPAEPDAFRVFIAPLIFGLAPVINVVVSMFWDPQKGDPFNFVIKSPHPLLWLGIILVGVGAGLVLYSKEKSEASSGKPNPTGPVETKPAPPEKPAEPKP